MVAIDNVMAKILWSRYFIETQGYKISRNKLMHVRKVVILLENNVKLSISKWEKHIKTSYLFVNCIVAQGDLEI